MHPFVDIHSHYESVQSGILKVLNIDPYNQKLFKTETFFSAGYHPWKLPDQYHEWYLLLLRKLARNEQCVAIGECGLDFYKGESKDLQKYFFLMQAEIAEEFGLPLIIHCVKAFHEIFALKKELKPQVPWILHGFEKNQQTAEQCIKSGLYLSVGSKVSNPGFADVLKYIPLERLFTETDTSMVAIENIYGAIAAAKNIELDDVKQQIIQNARICFQRLKL